MHANEAKRSGQKTMSTTESRQKREESGLHPFYVGLFLLLEWNGYKVWTNDTYTSGCIDCPSGWVDHWIRYAHVEGFEMSFAYDAPHKVPDAVQQKLGFAVRDKLERRE